PYFDRLFFSIQLCNTLFSNVSVKLRSDNCYVCLHDSRSFWNTTCEVIFSGPLFIDQFYTGNLSGYPVIVLWFRIYQILMGVLFLNSFKTHEMRMLATCCVVMNVILVDLSSVGFGTEPLKSSS